MLQAQIDASSDGNDGDNDNGPNNIGNGSNSNETGSQSNGSLDLGTAETEQEVAQVLRYFYTFQNRLNSENSCAQLIFILKCCKCKLIHYYRMESTVTTTMMQITCKPSTNFCQRKEHQCGTTFFGSRKSLIDIKSKKNNWE